MFEKEAEEYAQGMAMYYESAHGSIPSQFEKYLRKAVEYGYNKANEWHDLRKDPNDLPKEVKNGRSKVVYGDKGEPIYFSYKTNWWKDYSDHERYPPIAWCEIPKFEK